MTLTVGTGPFGHAPAGEFNTRLPDYEGLLYLEPSPRRVRGVAGGETVIDSSDVRMLHEHGRLPIWLFPQDDVRMDLLEPGEQREGSANKGPQRMWSLRAGDRVAEDAAWDFPEPPGEAAGLSGLIAFEWSAMDDWYEEDEVAIVHPRDPYHRVDVLDTSRHVRVSLNGELVAETRRAKVIYETGLPARWYIPPEDVRDELLEASDTETGCAYKGFASYSSVRAGGELEQDLVWTYPESHHDAARVAGYLAFFNERVDIEVDGELQERPLTPWSPQWKGPRPGPPSSRTD